MRWFKAVLSVVAMLVASLAWAAFEITPAVHSLANSDPHIPGEPTLNGVV